MAGNDSYRHVPPKYQKNSACMCPDRFVRVQSVDSHVPSSSECRLHHFMSIGPWVPHCRDPRLATSLCASRKHWRLLTQTRLCETLLEMETWSSNYEHESRSIEYNRSIEWIVPINSSSKQTRERESITRASYTHALGWAIQRWARTYETDSQFGCQDDFLCSTYGCPWRMPSNIRTKDLV